MDRQISLSRYRTIDLVFLGGILAISQVLIYYASSAWFTDQLYLVSPVAVVVALVMMRWNGYAAIHALLGGLLFTALSGGSWQQYVIYGGGNLVSMIALVMFKLFGKERIRNDTFLTVVFALCVQLLMQLGRAGLAAVLGFSGDACLGFITTDILSELFTFCVIWIVRRIDGLFEDQVHYLLRVKQEQ